MIYLGVDPGMTGAIAFIFNGRPQVEVYDFEDPACLIALQSLVSPFGISYAMVEKVNAMPKQGVSTTFKFGVSYGRVMGWLDAYQIPYELVTPQKWWKAMSDSAPRKDKKEMALDLARRLFPSIAASHLARKKDHNRAEALLIAEYCKRMKSSGP